MNIHDIAHPSRPLTMLTCYDYWSAQLLNRTAVDMLLVGDSLAMVMHGEASTLPADVELMALHTRAVARGAPDKFIVADLPFLSYRKSQSEAVAAVQSLMQAGGHAVKLEGVTGNETLIRHLVDSGVPVMGHIGLTPQAVNALGGYKVQGKDQAAATRLIEEAQRLEQAGCFSLVIECVPAALGKAITEAVAIPTIGIGAGPDTTGQVLVLHDMLGFNTDFKPRFVRQFAQGADWLHGAVERFVDDVQCHRFPAANESYP